MERKKTIGEIAKSHGFDNVDDFFSKVNETIKIAKEISFNVNDKVKLKLNFTPTHFNKESILPLDTEFIVAEKSNFTLDSYSIKLKGYNDIWFNASVFEFSDEK